MNIRTFLFSFFKIGISLPTIILCLALSLLALTIDGQTINNDRKSGDKRFDGIGAVNGGETTTFIESAGRQHILMDHDWKF